jgi:hypothetical protein
VVPKCRVQKNACKGTFLFPAKFLCAMKAASDRTRGFDVARKAKAKDTSRHLRLRLEPSLLTRLERAAERSGKTLTGEITGRLQRSFEEERDAAILNLLVGGNDTYADVFRKIVLELQANAGWDKDKAQRLQISDRVRALFNPPPGEK